MCTDIIGAILYAYLVSTTHDSYSSVTVTLHILQLTYFSINEDHFATWVAILPWKLGRNWREGTHNDTNGKKYRYRQYLS